MNKKKYGIIAAVAAVILILGVFFAVRANSAGKENYEKNQYIAAMNGGKDAVDAKDYRAAKKYFDRAEAAKKGDEKAVAYGNQADNFIKANDSIDDFEFESAIDHLDDVRSEPTGYKKMNKQASSLKDKLNTVLDNIDMDITPLQDEAKAAIANRDYNGAIVAYDKILSLDYIKGKYYKKIYKEVTADKAEAQNMLNSNPKPESSSSSSSSVPNMNTEGATDKDKEIDGKEVTPEMIANARAQMKALGTNPGPWSNFDVIKLIQISVANGHKQITQADIDQFLK